MGMFNVVSKPDTMMMMQPVATSIQTPVKSDHITGVNHNGDQPPEYCEASATLAVDIATFAAVVIAATTRSSGITSNKKCSSEREGGTLSNPIST